MVVQVQCVFQNIFLFNMADIQPAWGKILIEFASTSYLFPGGEEEIWTTRVLRQLHLNLVGRLSSDPSQIISQAQLMNMHTLLNQRVIELNRRIRHYNPSLPTIPGHQLEQYNMEDEIYLLLLGTASFSRNFSKICINLMEYSAKSDILAQQINLSIVISMTATVSKAIAAYQQPGRTYTAFTIIPDSTQIAPAYNWDQVLLIPMFNELIPKLPRDMKWVTKVLSLLNQSIDRYLAVKCFGLGPASRFTFHKQLQDLLTILNAGNEQLLFSADKFCIYAPETLTPSPTPPDLYKHEDIISALLSSSAIYQNGLSSFPRHFSIVYITLIEGVRKSLHDHHQDDWSFTLNIILKLRQMEIQIERITQHYFNIRLSLPSDIQVKPSLCIHVSLLHHFFLKKINKFFKYPPNNAITLIILLISNKCYRLASCPHNPQQPTLYPPTAEAREHKWLQNKLKPYCLLMTHPSSSFKYLVYITQQDQGGSSYNHQYFNPPNFIKHSIYFWRKNLPYLNARSRQTKDLH